jgi:hypothetical protein
VIETIHQGLKADGIHVSMSKLCQWFGVSRRTLYYRPTKTTPVVNPRFAEPIKAMIEENPSFGYRTVAHLLDFNKNTVGCVPGSGVEVVECELGSSARVASYRQASAGAAGSLIGGFSLIIANDSRLM